jgi:hypothetical protein
MNGNRRYGCLLRAGGGVVEDNIFEDTTGAGGVLTNEPDWPESPVPGASRFVATGSSEVVRAWVTRTRPRAPR